MLPFLRPRRQDAGVIVQKTSDDGSIKRDEKDFESDELEGLKAAMSDFLRAVHSKDEHAMAEAFKAAFEICESYPHEEGPHTDEEE